MHRSALLCTLVSTLAGCACMRHQDATHTPPRHTTVRFHTSAGDFDVLLDAGNAPITVANFLRYVDEQAYDNTIFHRVIPTFVIQGGGYSPDFVELPSHEPISNEWTNGLKNVRGSIAMARDTDPDSATRQFYFNVADNHRLDTPREVSGGAGYAVFGRVVSGMHVIDAIKDAPTHDRSDDMRDVPNDPVVVFSVRRLD